MESEPVIMLAGIDCARGREKEFTEWYHSTFPQIMMKAPGVVSVERFERLEDNDEYPRFISVVQIENEAAIAKMDSSEAIKEISAIMLEEGPKWEITTRWVVHYGRIFTSNP
jgi:hypothetical protein